MLSRNGIDADLAAEKQQVAGPSHSEVEDSRILEEELALFWKEELVGRQVELLRVYVRVCKIGICSQIGNQVRTEADFHVQASRIKGFCTRRQAC